MSKIAKALTSHLFLFSLVCVILLATSCEDAPLEPQANQKIQYKFTEVEFIAKELPYVNQSPKKERTLISDSVHFNSTCSIPWGNSQGEITVDTLIRLDTIKIGCAICRSCEFRQKDKDKWGGTIIVDQDRKVLTIAQIIDSSYYCRQWGAMTSERGGQESLSFLEFTFVDLPYTINPDGALVVTVKGNELEKHVKNVKYVYRYSYYDPKAPSGGSTPGVSRLESKDFVYDKNADAQEALISLILRP